MDLLRKETVRQKIHPTATVNRFAINTSFFPVEVVKASELMSYDVCSRIIATIDTVR